MSLALINTISLPSETGSLRSILRTLLSRDPLLFSVPMVPCLVLLTRRNRAATAGSGLRGTVGPCGARSATLSDQRRAHSDNLETSLPQFPISLMLLIILSRWASQLEYMEGEPQVFRIEARCGTLATDCPHQPHRLTCVRSPRCFTPQHVMPNSRSDSMNRAKCRRLSNSSELSGSGSKCMTSFRIRLTVRSCSTNAARSIRRANFPQWLGFSNRRIYSPIVRSATLCISRSESFGSQVALSSS